jgi:hypothetical protein
VSGGIAGVILCVIGAYFLGTEELRADSGRLDRLEEMVAQLHAALLDRPDAPPVVPVAAPSGNGEQPAAEVVAVAGGETFHRPSCAMATGKESESLTPSAARTRGLTPCKLCEPAGELAG